MDHAPTNTGRTSTALARAIAGLAMILLAACQTTPERPLMSPLDEERGGFGYSERHLAGERYEVSYDGPNRRTWLDGERRAEHIDEARALAYDLALWRAADLALENGFAAFIVAERQTDVEVEIIEDAPFYAFAGSGGGFRHGMAYHAYAYPIPVLRSAWLRARVGLTVDLLAATEVEGAFDAAATAARLAAKHADALVVPAP